MSHELVSRVTHHRRHAEQRALEHQSSTALEHDDEVQSRTNMSTIARPRALEHEHEVHTSTRTSFRAQARGGQAISASRQQNFRTTSATCRTFKKNTPWVSMGLDGCTCSECLPVVTCDSEPPEHMPRTSARPHTYCGVVFGRAPCVPRSH